MKMMTFLPALILTVALPRCASSTGNASTVRSLGPHRPWRAEKLRTRARCRDQPDLCRSQGSLAHFSGTQPRPTLSAFYNTVSAFEYADLRRTHLPPAYFYGAASGGTTLVTTRGLERLHEGPYKIVTRDRNEAFVYGTSSQPYVVKFDLASGQVAWNTELPTIEGNVGWTGLVAVHGNGHLYAVHSRTLVRINPASGAIKKRADLPAP